MQPLVRLRFVSGPFEGRVHEYVDHNVVTVGRSRDAAIRLPPDDHSASRHHFVLEVNPPDAVLRDLGSLHGTIVHGSGRERAVEPGESIDLHDGDEISAGDSAIRVELCGSRTCPTCGGELDKGPQCTRCVTTQMESAGGEGACERCGRPTEVPGEDTGPVRLCPACVTSAAVDAAARPSDPRREDTPLPRLPGYRPVRQLGAGGMGSVYLAERTSDGTWVALKLMLARVAVQEEARKRFAREVRITDQLAHPHIVRCLDQGSIGQAFYFAMELCPAGSVQRLIVNRGGRLSLGEAVDIALQALEGLDHAHACLVHDHAPNGAHSVQHCVVHRDIKPGNLLLCGSERGWIVKLSDFGLAKGFDDAGLSGCTASGFLGGSFPFMAPEQLRDFKRAGPSCDLWSLAATLYTMLAGSDPRRIAHHPNPLSAILEGRITPLRDVAPTVPASVASVIESALDVDPDKRPQSAGWLISDLSRAVYGPDATSRGVPLVALDTPTSADAAVLVLAPRPPAPWSPRRAREANRGLHDSIVSVCGHAGPRALSLHAEGAVVVLDSVDDALELARRVELTVDRKHTPVRRALHVAHVSGSADGLPTGPGIAWAWEIARAPAATPDLVLVSTQAAAALPPAALTEMKPMGRVSLGPDRVSTRLLCEGVRSKAHG